MEIEEQEAGLLTFDETSLQYAEGVQISLRPLADRVLYEEDASIGLAAEAVLQEAKRCYNCGCVAASPSDAAPALLALDAIVVTNKREIAAEAFFSTGISSSTVLRQGEIVTEIVLPSAAAGKQHAFAKYRMRKSIDFPLADVAVTMDYQGGRVSDARVVLGAAAPVPMRFKDAEAFLEGKAVDFDTAKEAAAIVMSNAMPLEKNKYKAAYIQAYVRRMIMAAAGVK